MTTRSRTNPEGRMVNTTISLLLAAVLALSLLLLAQPPSAHADEVDDNAVTAEVQEGSSESGIADEITTQDTEVLEVQENASNGIIGEGVSTNEQGGETALAPLAQNYYVNVSAQVYYSYAYEVLRLINIERTNRGLRALVMNAELLAAANQRAAEITLTFSHTRPDGTECFTASPYMRGENIAAGYTSPSAVVQTWMNSAGHRGNILNANYTEIGIGAIWANTGYYYFWTQCFGTRANPVSISQPSNTSATFKVLTSTGTVALNGWVYDSNTGNWSYYTNSVAATNTWKYINNYWYYFNAQGVMLTGSFKDAYGRYFYLGAPGDGKMKTGWQLHPDGWRYHNDGGAHITGWHNSGANWWYLDASNKGLMADRDNYLIGNKVYSFKPAPSGAMKTGWVLLSDGTWIFHKPAPSGAAVTGWYEVSGKWYYFAANASAKPLTPGRYMVTGRHAIGSGRYILGPNGAMVTGWVNYGTATAPIWRYYKPAPSGAEVSGWLSYNGYWYYLNPTNDNIMAVGRHVYAPDNNAPFYSDFDASGKWKGRSNPQ